MDELDTRTKLLEATLSLIAETGLHGATTRSIAARAEVNEVTLFRQFGSKAALLGAAIAYLSRDFQQAVQAPSGDLRTDLVRLAQTYTVLETAFGGAIVRLMPEFSRHPLLKETALPLQKQIIASLLELFKHYSDKLADDAPENLLLSFMGPLVTKGIVGDAVGLSAPFDAERYVALYLEGHMKRKS